MITTTMPSLKTTVAGIPLETCIYNASGPRTGSSAALAKIAASKSGAVLAKSATLEKQTGNPLPRTWQSDEASLNSEGLPNAGIDYYLDQKTIEESLGETNKPYMLSISGKTVEDNVEMIKKVIKQNAVGEISCLELNLACPNVIGKPIIAYDFDQMKSVLAKVSKIPGIQSLVLGVKMPPYFDGPHFEAAASILNQYKHIVNYVASINTIGNALAIDSIAEMPYISSKGGFAGLSGKAIKYTALANVRQMRMLLDKEIDVVGVGGVETGQDAFELILCGATAVQVGTCHWREGPACFDRICDELCDIMKEKGYETIDDFKGKLKEWNKEGANLSREKRKNKHEPVKERGGTDLLNVIIAFLVVIIAMLLADKYGVVNIQ
jgi:dihydroorotate dehydrogenase (fumarate)